jgi:TRAP-type C4-dicarboxylate transport system substrate-binding protein
VQETKTLNKREGLEMEERKTMQFFILMMICLGLVFSCFFPGTGYAKTKEIRLKFAFYPPAKVGAIFQEFCKDLEKRSGGRMKADFYGGGSLLKAPQVYEGILTGITDMGYCHIEYTTGRFPVTAARQLPLGYPSAWVANQVANDFHNEFKMKEWDDVKVLWMHSSPPQVFITTKPVRNLADLKGLIIRAPGMAGKIVKALGATPSPTPMMEVYDAISKGVIQGVFVPYEGALSFHFADIAKYITESWAIGNTYAFYIAMNKNSYNQLPSDMKVILERTCGEYREKIALWWNVIDHLGKGYALKKNVEIITLPPEELKKWQNAASPVIDDYVNDMVTKGYTESEVRGWIKYLRDRIDYWTKEQIRNRIISPTGPPEMTQ